MTFHGQPLFKSSIVSCLLKNLIIPNKSNDYLILQKFNFSKLSIRENKSYKYNKTIAATIHTGRVLCKDDYHKILGVPTNADPITIKKAYLDKAKQYHPDKNLNDPSAAEKFYQISRAYEVLGEKDKIQVHFIRGKYLLSQITNETQEEIERNLDRLKVDDEFLMKIMNIRENIEHSSSDNGYIIRELEKELDEMAKKLSHYLESKNVDKIYEQLAKLKFIANCVEVSMAR